MGVNIVSPNNVFVGDYQGVFVGDYHFPTI